MFGLHKETIQKTNVQYYVYIICSLALSEEKKNIEKINKCTQAKIKN